MAPGRGPGWNAGSSRPLRPPLARDGSVFPVDVLAAIGRLPQSIADRWRQERVECLEHLAPVRPDKLAAALEHLRGVAGEARHSRSAGLMSHESAL
jgi:hypothetical protein